MVSFHVVLVVMLQVIAARLSTILYPRLVIICQDVIVVQAGSLEQPFALATSSSAFVMAIQKNVLVFFSVIPPPRPAATSLQTLMWARPVIIVLVAFLAVWHFGNQRR